MNMRPENRCGGSLLPAASTPRAIRLARTSCPRCGRRDVRVRVDGSLYVHARRPQ